jgi:hypothetical protein
MEVLRMQAARAALRCSATRHKLCTPGSGLPWLLHAVEEVANPFPYLSPKRAVPGCDLLGCTLGLHWGVPGQLVRCTCVLAWCTLRDFGGCNWG